MTEKPFLSPRIEVSLDNIVHNISEIKKIMPSPKGIMAVVKDLAYGCGSVMVSKTLEANGVAWLAVAFAGEARAIRVSGVTLPILILGECDKDELAWGTANNISFSLNDPADITAWGDSGLAVRFHINIDTGMGRLGLLSQQLDAVIDAVKCSPRLVCEGAFTHLACADIPGTDSVAVQLKRFRTALDALRQHGISPRHIHYANSSAIMRFPVSAECTLVRPGITIYGCKPDPGQDFPLDLRSAIALKAHVVKIKRVSAGTPISYGGRYVAPCDTNIATIPLGYGIGLPRLLTNKGAVLIGGNRYTIAGTVTMDYIMVDAGPRPQMKAGDEAVAIGYQGSEYISPDEVARMSGTIAYEILCGLSTKLDRYYFQNGAMLHYQPGYYF
jgi:alanine racemase